MNAAFVAGSISPLDTAKSLQAELERQEIFADVHDGYGLALVSVWVGLIVWCDGDRFWWRTGWDDRRKRFTYAWHPAIEPARAAHRVAFRYRDLRNAPPPSESIAESAPCSRSTSA
ncbi:hypothetical protein OHA77_20625 [Streptosporangium sp. NBC_01639]|uniref:hypothetical protein n=1 Tax=Streptosporangium sp. NBC_01639 TaxID=2975948 RepID=UPI00386832FC|nr:hypothetical protein OHA77_20625 [Streptosporangium sp. NBC_01639]